MKNNFKNIYQFKITLIGIKPPIWRRIQVPENYTFWDFHVAIQDSMGWLDYHLHQFNIVNPNKLMEETIGIPYDNYDDIEVLAGWDKKISSYFSMKNPKAAYEYDLGDYWVHTVELEKILPVESRVTYPQCIDGERACPPEDCGGIGGYEKLLKIIKDSMHPEHEDYLEWLGGSFDPESFDPREVEFADPEERYKYAFTS